MTDIKWKPMSKVDKGFEMALDNVIEQTKEKFRIYTSYWAQVDKVSAAGLVNVGISRFSPGWITQIKTYMPLAPTPTMLGAVKKGSMDDKFFEKVFLDMLEELDAKEVFLDLQELGNGKSVALICYEKPPQWCHRHSVARWLERELGIKVEEFPFKN